MYASRIVNCTPHVINFGFVEGDNVDIISFDPSGNVARCDVEEKFFDTVWLEHDGGDFHFPIYKRKFTDVVDLPAPEDGVLYIVSAVVLESSDRRDLIAPDSGKSAVRNEKGHIQYVTRWIQK